MSGTRDYANKRRPPARARKPEKKWKDLVSLSIIRLYTERKEKMNASREQGTQNCHRILCQRKKKERCLR